MANAFYNRAKANLFQGTDLTSADVRALLVNTNYTYDADHNFVSDLSANEFSGTGYSRQALTGEAVSQDDVNDRAEFTSDKITFSSVSDSGTQIQALVLFVQVTNDADSYLLAYIDTVSAPGFPVSANGGDIEVSPDAEGWLQLT